MLFFATAAKGTEGLLRDELREIGLHRIRADRGGVHFEGELIDGYRACLHSRIAVRILLHLATFEAANEEDLYHGVRTIDFEPFFSPDRTFAVKASCRSSALTHTQFIAQKTKDAIVDRQRDQFGSRSNVAPDDPDVLAFVHLVSNRASVYVDLAGQALHLRGYRTQIGEAPLKETLAAALLRFSGWDRNTPLLDPLCGAGTIAIEASLWARAVAPGLRRRFGFERWLNFDATAKRSWEGLKIQAHELEQSDGPPIFASDHDAAAIASAHANAQAASAPLFLARRTIAEIEPLIPAGFVVANPPYGERLQINRGFEIDLVRALRSLSDHTIAILAGSFGIREAMRIRPEKWLALFNGPLQCQALLYRIR